MLGTGAQQRLKAAGFSPGPIDGVFGTRSYAALLSFAARRDLGADGIKMASICAVMFPEYDISDTANSLAQFLATCSHETGNFTQFAECLYYTHVDQLLKTWPHRFLSRDDATYYLKKPRELADHVYGYKARHGTPGDLGNRPGTNDAYDMRGGGWIQTTGYANYLNAQKVTGLPLVAHPELMHDPLTSIEPACAYWKAVGCNELANADPTGMKARVKVNGGTIGLQDVLQRVPRLVKVIAG
jgi:putative chitinase